MGSKKYGYCHRPTYDSWVGMKRRCSNPNFKSYKDYGGRGVRVCPRWDNFENFLQDMGEKPPGMSIERVDNDGDYSPENCMWASVIQQNRNARSNVCYYIGNERVCESQLARALGVSQDALSYKRRKLLGAI